MASLLERLTERHIFTVHVHKGLDLLQVTPEPWILDALHDTLLDEHPAHTGIRHFHILWGGHEVFRSQKLERTRLGEILLVPILDGRDVLQVLHHVVTGRDVVWALEDPEKVLWLENDIRIDPHHGIVIHLALERLLVRTLEDVAAEALGTGEMHDGRVLLTDHNLVTLGGGLHQKVRPGQQELTRVRATGHTEDDLH